MSMIRIASGQGFWGDLPNAPLDQITYGKIDYLVMDYLAEVTMAIMQKQYNRDPQKGYATDFIEIMVQLMPILAQKGIKVITNAGGVNPHACVSALLSCMKQQNINLKVGAVFGDNILNQTLNRQKEGESFSHLETKKPLDTLQNEVISSHVYFGAQPVVECLQKGADIVITGRVTDTGLTLAPMIYTFGWSYRDYHRLAQGIVAGHILECGGQATGGNFTDWHAVPDLDRIGFPIAEVYDNGKVVITKHDELGGMVNIPTVSEQLVYEIGDPTQYITPEVVVDFTSIKLNEDGKNRVGVSNVRGLPATPYYKVAINYKAGYRLLTELTYYGCGALYKATSAAEILCNRIKRKGFLYSDIHISYIGYNGCNLYPVGNNSSDYKKYNEIVMRVCFKGENYDHLVSIGKEIAPLILTGPSASTGFAGGRPKPTEIIGYWPCLISKKKCFSQVKIF